MKRTLTVATELLLVQVVLMEKSQKQGQNLLRTVIMVRASVFLYVTTVNLKSNR